MQQHTLFKLKLLQGIHLVITFFVLLSISFFSQAALFKKDKTQYFPTEHLPRESLVPGGIALLPFRYTRNEIPHVTFQEQRVMVLNVARNEWIAVVGLSLNLQVGEHQLKIIRKGKTQTLHFAISDKAYEEQYITLKDKKQVSPSPEALKRIGEESALMKTAFKAWNEQTPTSLTMDYPVTGPLSSQFGLKRFFNQQARSPHSGIDIAAPQGSIIKTPLAGTVSAAGNYYFNGNTLLIDHGQGLVSMYCHLDTMQVNEGQTLTAEQVIGTVGSTGRATGPHLHWSINLNNTRVDPLLFLKNQPN